MGWTRVMSLRAHTSRRRSPAGAQVPQRPPWATEHRPARSRRHPAQTGRQADTLMHVSAKCLGSRFNVGTLSSAWGADEPRHATYYKSTISPCVLKCVHIKNVCRVARYHGDPRVPKRKSQHHVSSEGGDNRDHHPNHVPSCFINQEAQEWWRRGWDDVDDAGRDGERRWAKLHSTTPPAAACADYKH